jgi:hypothetical protein
VEWGIFIKLGKDKLYVWGRRRDCVRIGREERDALERGGERGGDGMREVRKRE